MKIIFLSDNQLDFLHEIKLCNIFIILTYVCIFVNIWANFKSFLSVKQFFEVLIAFLGWLIMLAAYKGAKTWKI